MNNKILMTGLIAVATLAMAGCTKQVVEPSSTSGISSVVDYKYTDKSKAFMNLDGSADEAIEISEYVSEYNKGDLWLSEDGLDKVFGLKNTAATEEEKTLLSRFEKENSYEGVSEEVIKLQNDEHYFLFREGSTLFVCDGDVKNMTEPIVTQDGKHTYPLFDIVFCLGYDSIGTAINEDSVYYTVYKPIALESTPDYSNVPEDEEASVEHQTGESMEQSISEDGNTQETSENVTVEESDEATVGSSDSEVVPTETPISE